LSHAGIKCDIEHINLKNPPDWFGDVSPLKKVPVLQVGSVAIYDSSIICDYLDDEFKLNLRPEDHLQRADMRSTVEYIGACTQQFFTSLLAAEVDQFRAGLLKFNSLLSVVEKYFSRNRDFYLNQFSMIDIAIAPLLVRINYVEEITGVQTVISEARFPVLFQIKEKTSSNRAVLGSLDEDSKERFLEFLKNNNSVLFSDFNASSITR
jgi:glutathione S-transferase